MLVIRQILLSDTPTDVLGADVDVTRPYRLHVSTTSTAPSEDVKVYLGDEGVNITSWPDDGSWDNPSFDFAAYPLGSFPGLTTAEGIHLDGVRLFAVCQPIEDTNVYLRVLAYGE